MSKIMYKGQPLQHGAGMASEILYDGSESGLKSTTVQTAIDELKKKRIPQLK